MAINYRVLAAAAVAAVGVAIAVTPLSQSSPMSVAASLTEAGRAGTAGPRRQRARLLLLVSEVALAVVLLIGSGLFVSSFVRLMRVDLGFDMTNLVAVDLSPRSYMRSRGVMQPRIAQSIDAAFAQVSRVPGVERAALVVGTPPLVDGTDRTSVLVVGRGIFGGDDSPDDKTVTPDYFSVFRVPVIAGRTFSDADSMPGAPPVVMLNDVAASRYFEGRNPIGGGVKLARAAIPATVIGVVRSVRLLGPESELRPEIYKPLDWHDPLNSPVLTLVARTSREPGAVAGAIRSAIQTAAPDLVIPDAESYDALFERLIAQRKFNMWVLALFGLLAITIAGAGIYGVMAFIVEQRTREIGVRIALGARPSRVIGMVLAQAAMCIGAGLAAGLVAGWMLSRSVQSFLFRVDAHDPVVYAAASAVLIAAGLLAALIPACRAARVDPIAALRT